jgi:hypothetical protein
MEEALSGRRLPEWPAAGWGWWEQGAGCRRWLPAHGFWVEEGTSGEKTVGESSGLRSARESPRDDHFVSPNFMYMCFYLSYYLYMHECSHYFLPLTDMKFHPSCKYHNYVNCDQTAIISHLKQHNENANRTCRVNIHRIGWTLAFVGEICQR